MDRRDSVLKYVTKDQKGIEIGPWFNPLAPKREGYKCLVLDVFDLETLREKATNWAKVPDDVRDRTEAVDLLGSSTHIEELVASRGELGKFDYIISSHNFEHLPNPVRFLQGCAKVLKPGGMISMAIPDRRACFDYFRPVTTLSSWLTAYLADTSRPTPAQYFEMATSTATFDTGAEKTISFHRGVPLDKVSVSLRLDESYAEWLDSSRQDEYHDTHCSVFTPSSFELLIRDSGYLGLTAFEVVEIFDSPGVEFYAHLRLNTSPDVLRPANYEATRNEILRNMLDEAAETSSLRVESSELRAKNESLEEGEALRREIGEMSKVKDSLTDALESMRREVERLAERGTNLERELREVRSSTSWRLTSPLRRLISTVRGSR